MMELGLVEHVGEGGNGQREIPVLLHVEVDEPVWLFQQRCAIDLAERLFDPLDAAIEVENIEVGDQRRSLDRHRVDVGATQLVENLGDPSPGFVVTEDRLAQWVHQQTNAFAAALLGVCAELRVFRRQHDSSGLGEDSTANQGHDDLWQRSGELGACLQQQTVDVPERRRKPVSGHYVGEPTPGAAVRTDAQHLVGEPLNQLVARRIGDQPAETMQLAPFSRSRAGGRLAQQRIGERHRLLCQLQIVEMRMVERGGHHHSHATPRV